MQVIVTKVGNGVAITPAPYTPPEGVEWRLMYASSLPSRDSRDRWLWTSSGPLDVAAATVPVPESISFAQMLIGLVSEGWITEQEGTDWLAGTLPTPVETLIGTLPSNQRFAARARASRPSVILRNDPLLIALGAAQGKTSNQLDTFFITYSQV